MVYPVVGVRDFAYFICEKYILDIMRTYIDHIIGLGNSKPKIINVLLSIVRAP